MAPPPDAVAGVSLVAAAYRGMSADNIKGLALALSSSAFIGASFIVKKKGLKKAAAAGDRAGESVRSVFGISMAWLLP